MSAEVLLSYCISPPFILKHGCLCIWVPFVSDQKSLPQMENAPRFQELWGSHEHTITGVNSIIPWFSYIDITAHMNFMIVPDLYSFHAASMTKACCDGPALRTLQGGDKVRSKWSCEFKRRLFLLPTEFQQQVKIIWTNSQKGSNKMPVSLPGNLDIQSFFCN